MNFFLQPKIFSILLVLICTITKPITSRSDPQELMDACEFEPKFEYIHSRFYINASNPLISNERWLYRFDVKKQEVTILQINGTITYYGILNGTANFAFFNYTRHEATVVCLSNINERVFKHEYVRIDESYKLPSVFPPGDSKPCGVSYHDGDEVFSYYSEDFDFWFSIKLTGQGKCRMHEFALPGQAKPHGTCFDGDTCPGDWSVKSVLLCPEKKKRT